MSSSEINLRRALWANVFFSTTCALISLFFFRSIATWMNIGSAYIMLGIGIGLLFFAASIVHLLRKKEMAISQVKAIIIQDWLWVIGSAVILLSQGFGLSNGAYWLIGGIALIVMDLALVQGYFLRKSKV